MLEYGIVCETFKNSNSSNCCSKGYVIRRLCNEVKLVYEYAQESLLHKLISMTSKWRALYPSAKKDILVWWSFDPFVIESGLFGEMGGKLRRFEFLSFLMWIKFF